MTAPETLTRHHHDRTGSRPPLTHAEHPARPGVALCGVKLTERRRSSGAERCVVCLDLTRRPFAAR